MSNAFAWLLLIGPAAFVVASVLLQGVSPGRGRIAVAGQRETLLATCADSEPASRGDVFSVRGFVDLLPAVGTNAVIVTIHRGADSRGPLIHREQFGVPLTRPGGFAFYLVECTDEPGEGVKARYSMSLQQMGADGDGIAAETSLEAARLNG